jgi:hypothetical protein
LRHAGRCVYVAKMTFSKEQDRKSFRLQIFPKSIPCYFVYWFLHFIKSNKATTGFVPIGYREALLSSLLQVNVYVAHNLLNVLVQIANKMGLHNERNTSIVVKLTAVET